MTYDEFIDHSPEAEKRRRLGEGDTFDVQYDWDEFLDDLRNWFPDYYYGKNAGKIYHYKVLTDDVLAVLKYVLVHGEEHKDPVDPGLDDYIREHQLALYSKYSVWVSSAFYEDAELEAAWETEVFKDDIDDKDGSDGDIKSNDPPEAKKKVAILVDPEPEAKYTREGVIKDASERYGLSPNEIASVTYIDQNTMKPVKFASAKTRKVKGFTELEKTVAQINEKFFKDGDNHLVVVRNDFYKTTEVRFAGKDTDPDRFADGEKSMMFSAQYDNAGKLCLAIKRAMNIPGYFDHLIAFGKEHPKDPARAPKDTPNSEDNLLDWRPETKDTPIPKDALDARLALLSPEDAETVKSGIAKNLVPDFLYHYMGGEERLGASSKSPVADEIMTMYMCACVSGSEDQAMRIFLSSAACRKWRAKETYDAAMKDAWANVSALRKIGPAKDSDNSKVM